MPASTPPATDPLAAHRALVAALAQPAAWPEPLPPGTRFAFIETHISTLILAGGHALKLKKPLRLPFLDFSTLARRQRFCAEELRLNRRTAPELYLGLRPVHGPPHAPRLGALLCEPPPADAPPAQADAPLDWALWMRRFDQAGLFDTLAQEGSLGDDDIDALAEEIARFHAALPPCPPTSALGEPAVLQRFAAQTLDELQASPLAGQLAPEIAARLPVLAQWSAERGNALAPLLQARRAAGAVVEGHGDLHLGNIVRLDGRPRLFDALEFDPGLRHADRMADLAFPFMDLLDHGLPRHAWRLLGRALESSGDHDGLPLLRWLTAYRALVRAKVALLGAAQGSAADTQRAAATRRIRLADTLAHPPPATILLVCGLSGSGKSTVAGLLAERIGAVRVRADVERKRLHGLAATARGADPSVLYGADSTRRTYDRLLEITRGAQAGAVGVVLDATYLQRADRDAAAALAATLGAPFAIVECHARTATLHARIRQRQAAADDPSDADLAVLARQQAMQQPPAPDEPVHRLDTEGNLATVAQRIESLLAHPRWPVAAIQGPPAGP
jgi:uncharacterized protein